MFVTLHLPTNGRASAVNRPPSKFKKRRTSPTHTPRGGGGCPFPSSSSFSPLLLNEGTLQQPLHLLSALSRHEETTMTVILTPTNDIRRPIQQQFSRLLISKLPNISLSPLHTATNFHDRLFFQIPNPSSSSRAQPPPTLTIFLMATDKYDPDDCTSPSLSSFPPLRLRHVTLK